MTLILDLLGLEEVFEEEDTSGDNGCDDPFDDDLPFFCLPTKHII